MPPYGPTTYQTLVRWLPEINFHFLFFQKQMARLLICLWELIIHHKLGHQVPNLISFEA